MNHITIVIYNFFVIVTDDFVDVVRFALIIGVIASINITHKLLVVVPLFLYC